MADVLEDAQDFATKEVGPLPLWGWAVAGVAGVALGVFVNRSLRSVSGPVPDPGAEAGPNIAADGSVRLGAPGVTTPSTSGGAEPGDDDLDGFFSNSDWRSAALALVVSRGGTAIETDQALAAYLDGTPLTPEQAGIIETVLSAIGLPPFAPTVQVAPEVENRPPNSGGDPQQPTPPIFRPPPNQPPDPNPTPRPRPPVSAPPVVTTPPRPTEPAPQPDPTPTPTPPHIRYTVQPGDSVSRVARRHGVSTQAVIDATREHGPGFPSGNVNLIHPGDILIIPR